MTTGDQIQIPCVMMRGGTSRGPFFLASDLPAVPPPPPMLWATMPCEQPVPQVGSGPALPDGPKQP